MGEKDFIGTGPVHDSLDRQTRFVSLVTRMAPGGQLLRQVKNSNRAGRRSLGQHRRSDESELKQSQAGQHADLAETDSSLSDWISHNLMVLVPTNRRDCGPIRPSINMLLQCQDWGRAGPQ